ncbi:hypothetical protein V6N11_068203 [Hibiscus sabdariffa]|uniref:Uncharacterized protein n=1 Tax=Hibiscus sabdariffa TaxID=183260 RepID=A0ABR2ST17_9ROSI
MDFCSQVYSGGLSRCRDEIFMETKDSRRPIEEQEDWSLESGGTRACDAKEGAAQPIACRASFPCGSYFRPRSIYVGIAKAWHERKEYVFKEPVPNKPGANAPRADKDKFKKHMDDMLDVRCLMLATMTPELQKQHEDMVCI